MQRNSGAFWAPHASLVLQNNFYPQGHSPRPRCQPFFRFLPASVVQRNRLRSPGVQTVQKSLHCGELELEAERGKCGRCTLAADSARDCRIDRPAARYCDAVK